MCGFLAPVEFKTSVIFWLLTLIAYCSVLIRWKCCSYLQLLKIHSLSSYRNCVCDFTVMKSKIPHNFWVLDHMWKYHRVGHATCINGTTLYWSVFKIGWNQRIRLFHDDYISSNSQQTHFLLLSLLWQRNVEVLYSSVPQIWGSKNK